MKNSAGGPDEIKQKQLLKLVTNSFIKELKTYGVDNKDIVKVSVNVLDYVTDSNEDGPAKSNNYSSDLSIEEIRPNYPENHILSFKDVSLKAMDKDMLPQLAEWLQEPENKQTLIRFFPTTIAELEHYFFGRPYRKYFAVFYMKENYVGIIGADNIDESCQKLEMKKFVGDTSFRSKGVGKFSTFLFLYYAFMKMEFNKVFIRSLDTNIKNINLNSKFGFELEGILYQETCIDNAYRDVLRMSLLRKKWLETFS